MSREYPCIYYENMRCKKYSDENINSWCVLGPCADRIESKADRIRAMSDEELAKILNAFSVYFESCNRSADEIDCKDCELYKLCTICEGQAMDWLQQPAEEVEKDA